MEVSSELVRQCSRRIMLSRMRILVINGFYGVLLMQLKMNLSVERESIWSDGKENIYINPHFLLQLSDDETDYCLVHVLLHILLMHTQRAEGYIRDIYDIAADIVVNSNILHSFAGDREQITLKSRGGIQPNLTPQGDEGWKYSVEEVYRLIEVDGNRTNGSGWDYHAEREKGDVGEAIVQQWKTRILNASETIKARKGELNRGILPAFVERFVEGLRNPQVDWKAVLAEFIQFEINDYSFTPPDRRYDDNAFFLPDYNEKDDTPAKLLFMIDTSRSMTDEMITTVYAEVKNAILMFGGKLEGWLGFFDTDVIPPTAFTTEEEFEVIRPYGGGGTSFDSIFSYIKEYMVDDMPSNIIILTDGRAPFPDVSASMGIPVLWIVINTGIQPPWGKAVQIKEDGGE